MDIVDEEIDWADSNNFDIYKIREYDDFMWIAARDVKWREV